MTDDKTKMDNRDRSQVAGGEDYEVGYFAEQAGITREQARDLIRQYGNDRELLMRHARKLG